MSPNRQTGSGNIPSAKFMGGATSPLPATVLSQPQPETAQTPKRTVFSLPPSPITHLSLLISHYPSPITHLSLLISHYPSPITHLSLLISHYPSPITHLSLPISPNTAIKFSLFQGVAPEFPISVRPADILCRGPDLFSGSPLVKPAYQGRLRRLSDLHPAEDGIYPTSKAARTNSEPPARYGHS